MLSTLDNLASIATALVAVAAYGNFLLRRWRKRWALEKYLLVIRNATKSPSRSRTDRGQRTILHLMSALRMTEAEILDVAFSSKRIVTLTGVDPLTARADCLLLQHVAGPK